MYDIYEMPAFDARSARELTTFLNALLYSLQSGSWLRSVGTHDDGCGSMVVTMDAVATVAIVESVADAVGATRIGHAAR